MPVFYFALNNYISEQVSGSSNNRVALFQYTGSLPNVFVAKVCAYSS